MSRQPSSPFAAARCGVGLLKGAARPPYPATEEGTTAWYGEGRPRGSRSGAPLRPSRRPGGHQASRRGRGGRAQRHGCQRRLPAADRGEVTMSASPAPDAAGNRDEPGPVAAVRRPWLTRNVAVLCGVSFLQDTASELLYPILPIFLTAVLGAPVAVRKIGRI